jgi:hypothetical protein
MWSIGSKWRLINYVLMQMLDIPNENPDPTTPKLHENGPVSRSGNVQRLKAAVKKATE